MKQTITHEIETDDQGDITVTSRYQSGGQTRKLVTGQIYSQVVLINVIGNHVYRFFLDPAGDDGPDAAPDAGGPDGAGASPA